MVAEIETNRHNNSPSLLAPHTYEGRLIAAEGLDGSGKSTQLRLLQFWLQAEGYEVVLAELKSSKPIKRALKAGKKEGAMDATLLSVLHAADFAELHERDIVPALKRGAIVLADRYAYTAMARDMARGVEADWIAGVYTFAVRPDLCLYFQMSVELSLERTLSHVPRLKYYQAGMDLGLSPDPIESFRAFQQRILGFYDILFADADALRLDATLPTKQQQRLLREAAEKTLPLEW